MSRLDNFPEIELSNEIDRSGKIGMYIILFCLVALALILAGYFVSKEVTDNNGLVTGIFESDESNPLPETQIEFSDASEKLAAEELVAEELVAEELATDENLTDEAAAMEEVVIADAQDQQESTENDADLLQTPLALEDVFDTGLMFVSASEPKYIITGDARRLDLGDEVDEQTLLAGITNENVILERRGNFIVIGLPDPSAE